ncbi:MAG TPA: ferrochelatase [Fimbriimonadaceae bacterium]|nr:ferrochelatase [Fimbriimonadaceae bacterium]
MSKIGLLVMHYGTPASLDEVLPYYTHIRHGRSPSDEALQDLVDRYKAIGGPSPLAHISERQAELIQKGLAKRGIETKLYVGAKHTHPFIEEAVAQMAADGIEEAVAVVLAPQYSSFSVVAYKKYIDKGLAEHGAGMNVEVVERWGTLPELIDGLAARVSEEMEGWNPAETLVIFSAHSLPEKIMAAGDPYQEELLETSWLVAEGSGIPNWTFGFQSASQTGEPWLGPDILQVIEENAPKYKNIVACTVGFVSDHLEVLYDLGIEAREKCEELGLNFRRAATIGEDPVVMDGLAGIAAEHLKTPTGA